MSDKQKDLIREVFLRNGFKIKAGTDDLADYVYTAAHELLQVAPDVQWDVVGWQFYQDGKWWNGDDRIKNHRKNTEAAGIPVRDLYAVPQPAEQQPDVAGLVWALKQILGWRELRRGWDFPIERIEDIARSALAAYRNQGGNT